MCFSAVPCLYGAPTQLLATEFIDSSLCILLQGESHEATTLQAAVKVRNTLYSRHLQISKFSLAKLH